MFKHLKVQTSSRIFPASAFIAGFVSLFQLKRRFASSCFDKYPSPSTSQAANKDRANDSLSTPSLSINRSWFSALRSQFPLLLLNGEESCCTAFPVRGSILYINGTELGIWILETFLSGTSSKYATRDLFKEIIRVRHRLRKEL